MTTLIETLKLVRTKLFLFDDVITDNFVFSLQRFHTVNGLVVFSILLSLTQVTFWHYVKRLLVIRSFPPIRIPLQFRWYKIVRAEVQRNWYRRN